MSHHQNQPQPKILQNFPKNYLTEDIKHHNLANADNNKQQTGRFILCFPSRQNSTNRRQHMADIKSMDRIAAKWQRVASGAQNEYTEGVSNPRTDWAKATKDAEPAYEAGLRASLANKSFGKGVTKAGTETWQFGAVKKGPSRFSEGVSLAIEDYNAGFSPYREVIARTVLPARGAKGDPKNIQRVAAIADALHKAKIARLGG